MRRRHAAGARHGAVRRLHLRPAGPPAQSVVHRQQDPDQQGPSRRDRMHHRRASAGRRTLWRARRRRAPDDLGRSRARQRNSRRDGGGADAHADSQRRCLAGDQQQGARRDLDHQDANRLLPVAPCGRVGRRQPRRPSLANVRARPPRRSAFGRPPRAGSCFPKVINPACDIMSQAGRLCENDHGHSGAAVADHQTWRCVARRTGIRWDPANISAQAERYIFEYRIYRMIPRSYDVVRCSRANRFRGASHPRVNDR